MDAKFEDRQIVFLEAKHLRMDNNGSRSSNKTPKLALQFNPKVKVVMFFSSKNRSVNTKTEWCNIQENDITIM